MAYGAFQANKIQLGRETVPGTAVPATDIWRGAFASLEDARTRETVDEQVGLLVNVERSYDSQLLARLSMPETPLTFEQVPHILEAGVETATPTGAGPYIREYAFPTTNTPAVIKTYTIEAYNAFALADYREMEYAFVEEFVLSMSAGEVWNMSANWVGRQLSTGAPTAGLNLISVEEALGPLTKLYIDATETAIGTTQMIGVLMGVEITVSTGWVIVPVGDGELFFAAIKPTMPEITFSITLELEENASGIVATERAAYEADTIRLIRLEIDGSDPTRSMVIDWAGKYDTISTYENTDGNTTVTFEGHAAFSPADSLYWETVVTNNIELM